MSIRHWQAWAWRLAILSVLWWAISGGDPASWAWGVPAIVAAAVLMPTFNWHLRPMALLLLIPHALWLALRGGLEVAWLACRPSLNLNTRVVEHPWHYLPEGPAQLFMASLINLVPGTLALRLASGSLQVHVLNLHDDTPASLVRLERRVAALFGIAIDKET
ncbi:Na+/H+ antiporter subunit E [Halomonas sp. M5N1S17]|uniref:Na+/H+ antiporter subunit E n=1 Tax=Halomonas alkalisoli TaxID=2907158 RepID=UPI001F283497|nr:Na+/H+ antiporter subunit E [Halomonas alkalisoli]MCE9662571.1 Na+/H+ antiporter subunit E [Halomonas alkalisoli]